MSEEDDWVESAIANDSLVAELLIGFHKRRATVFLEWGVRKPRSCNNNDDTNNVLVVENKKKGKMKSELTRASPTTPLSWSAGGTSNSAGDGYEESSVRLSCSRSKVQSSSEINNKRSRKKKTFAELKEEEGFLLNEAVNLKRALASEHVMYGKEKVRNESLKRLKLDWQLQSSLQPATSSDIFMKPTFNQSYHDGQVRIDQVPRVLPPIGKRNELDPVLGLSALLSLPSEARMKESVVHERYPVLPDLNMLPDLNLAFDEDLSAEV